MSSERAAAAQAADVARGDTAARTVDGCAVRWPLTVLVLVCEAYQVVPSPPKIVRAVTPATTSRSDVTAWRLLISGSGQGLATRQQLPAGTFRLRSTRDYIQPRQTLKLIKPAPRSP